MVGRVSKYKFNSYMIPRSRKNSIHQWPEEKHSIRHVLFLPFMFLFIYGSVALSQRAVHTNNLIMKNFEEKKNTQAAYDYMIFSMSSKYSYESNPVERFSMY